MVPADHDDQDARWAFLVSVVEAAATRWTEPDSGIWELRDTPRHLVHSKVACWAALDQGLRLAARTGRPAPLPRWRRVRDQIRAAVQRDGYDRHRGAFTQAFGCRYRADDGLGGGEGAFVACTFWLAECLARQGRLDQARIWFARAATTANDLGLLAEQVDPDRGELLGNFPQGLSHLAHLTAAVALQREAATANPQTDRRTA